MSRKLSLEADINSPIPHTGGYQESLGYTTRLNDAGHWVVELELVEGHLNQYGFAHGGIPLALLDTAGGVALYGAISHIKRMATISLNTNFIKGAELGLLTAIGNIEKGTGTICFTTMSLHQGCVNGPLLASAQASYRLFFDQ